MMEFSQNEQSDTHSPFWDRGGGGVQRTEKQQLKPQKNNKKKILLNTQEDTGRLNKSFYLHYY